MRFLECHDPNKYRKKIKGFHMAFNIRDKEQRISADDPSRKYKFKPSSQDTRQFSYQQDIGRSKDQTVKGKVVTDQAEREALRKMHEQMRKEKQKKLIDSGVPTQDGYLSIKHRQIGIPDSKHLKVTFDVIEKMHFSDFNEDRDDDFKPSDIVNDEGDSDEEEEILRKFKKEDPRVVSEQEKQDEDEVVNLPTPQVVDPLNEKILSIKRENSGRNQQALQQHPQQVKSIKYDQPISKGSTKGAIGLKRRGQAVNQSEIVSARRSSGKNESPPRGYPKKISAGGKQRVI